MATGDNRWLQGLASLQQNLTPLCSEWLDGKGGSRRPNESLKQRAVAATKTNGGTIRRCLAQAVRLLHSFLKMLMGKQMTIRSDPENNEIRALFDLVDFSGKHVIEIGSGDGRMTWRYAKAPAHIVAIEPFEEAIERAKLKRPDVLRDQVELHHIRFVDFASAHESETFDIAILSWSL